MIGLNWPRKTGSGGLLHFENGFEEDGRGGAVEVKIIKISLLFLTLPDFFRKPSTSNKI